MTLFGRTIQLADGTLWHPCDLCGNPLVPNAPEPHRCTGLEDKLLGLMADGEWDEAA